MEVSKEEPRQEIEPLFLSQAQTNGIKLRIGHMNKTEHEGIIRDIGRYEINIDENGKIVTLLKREISYLSAPYQVLTSPPSAVTSQSPPDNTVKPNVQQEFLEKAIKENQSLNLFLLNGLRVKAVIEAYDNFTILLKNGDSQQLYYKHAITTINR